MGYRERVSFRASWRVHRGLTLWTLALQRGSVQWMPWALGLSRAPRCVLTQQEGVRVLGEARHMARS